MKCRANGSTLQILNSIDNNSEPFHSLHRLLHPEIELFEIKVVCDFLMPILCSLAFQDSEKPVIFIKFSLNSEAERLSNLIAVRLELEVPLEPFVNLFEKPSELTELVNQFLC